MKAVFGGCFKFSWPKGFLSVLARTPKKYTLELSIQGITLTNPLFICARLTKGCTYIRYCLGFSSSIMLMDAILFFCFESTCLNKKMENIFYYDLEVIGMVGVIECFTK